MKKILYLLLFTTGIMGFSQNCDSSPNNAIEYLEDNATICGEVSQIYFAKDVKGMPTYINMGGKFPNHSFTIVIWGDSRDTFTYDLSELEGKQISVTGLIKEYKDKAQIVVETEEQIKLVVSP